MTIQDAMAALTPHYPTEPICIKCITWRYDPRRPLQITFSVWNGTDNFEARSLEAAVELAVNAIAPQSATLNDGQSFHAEAAQLATQQPA